MGAEGRCMSPERMEQSGRPHKPRRVGHWSGSYPEPGWHRGPGSRYVYTVKLCGSPVLLLNQGPAVFPATPRAEPLAGADEAALEAS